MLQSGSHLEDRSPGTAGVLPALHPEDLTDSLSEVDVGGELAVDSHCGLLPPGRLASPSSSHQGDCATARSPLFWGWHPHFVVRCRLTPGLCLDGRWGRTVSPPPQIHTPSSRSPVLQCVTFLGNSIAADVIR